MMTGTKAPAKWLVLQRAMEGIAKPRQGAVCRTVPNREDQTDQPGTLPGVASRAGLLTQDDRSAVSFPSAKSQQ